jgi:hypothetical protein
MPLTEFDKLPADSRVWVFAADGVLSESDTETLLAAVDEFLATWNAHGHPLRAGRDLREGRFLAIGVDQSTEGASGCSIDGLFRTLRDTQSDIGGNLLQGGRIFWRDDDGTIRSGTRAEFTSSAAHDTLVFDTTVATTGAWRDSFEHAARDGWHAQLLRAAGAF